MQSTNANSPNTSGTNYPPTSRRNIFINPQFVPQSRGVNAQNRCPPPTSHGIISSASMPPVWPTSTTSTGIPRFSGQMQTPPPTGTGGQWPPRYATAPTNVPRMPPPPGPPPPGSYMMPPRHPMPFPPQYGLMPPPPGPPPPGPPPFGFMPPQGPSQYPSAPCYTNLGAATCGPPSSGAFPPWPLRPPTNINNVGMFPPQNSTSSPSPASQWQGQQSKVDDRFFGDSRDFLSPQSRPTTETSATSRFASHHCGDDREHQRHTREREHQLDLRYDRRSSRECRSGDSGGNEWQTDREVQNRESDRRIRDRSPIRERRNESRRYHCDDQPLTGSKDRTDYRQLGELPTARGWASESRDRSHRRSEHRRSPVDRSSRRKSSDREAVHACGKSDLKGKGKHYRNERSGSSTENKIRKHDQEAESQPKLKGPDKFMDFELQLGTKKGKTTDDKCSSDGDPIQVEPGELTEENMQKNCQKVGEKNTPVTESLDKKLKTSSDGQEKGVEDDKTKRLTGADHISPTEGSLRRSSSRCRSDRSCSRAESGYHSPSRHGERGSSSTRHNSPSRSRRPTNSSREGSVLSRRSRSRDRSASRRRPSRSREPSAARYRNDDRSREPFQRPRCPSRRRSPAGFSDGSSRRSDSRARENTEEDEETRTLREFLTSQSVKLGENTLNACLNFDTKPRQYDDVESEESVASDEEKILWHRCSPADLYYERNEAVPGTMKGTLKLTELLDRFKSELVDRAERVRSARPSYKAPPRKEKKYPRPTSIAHSSDSEDMSEEDDSSDDDTTEKELERKRLHPDRLHDELWFNECGEMNDGPACRCSARARDCGIRHGIYPGEEPMPSCDPNSNNLNRLFHYRITMSPHINFLTKIPTIIAHDGHEFIFEGFSMFSHYPLVKLPTCKVIRFNFEYTIHYIEEKSPEHFTIRELELFYDYLYREILELVDLNIKAHGDKDGCKRFHFLPRFARSLEDSGKEVLSMNEVLAYLLASSKLLLGDGEIPVLMKMKQHEWQNYADLVKGQIVTYPGKRPCSLRVDQLDRDLASSEDNIYPEIIHFGIRPLQLSYAGNPTYRKSWHEYVKYRHLLANKPKVTSMDRHKLLQREAELQDMRTKSTLKRDVTVVIGSRGFYRTGIMCDMTQHAMLLPVLVSHLRFHKALDVLEDIVDYRFRNRHLLQLAMTHPSFRENFGTNPDHARNSLTNCGIRQPVYGDRRIHYVNTRKRGINTLITIMAKFGKELESYSNIKHNERLEFLGDAVVEFHSSIHLYHLFPELEEGGLATYRAAIVQNQHLAVLAKRLQLERFMLYAHGSDLCHDLELRHAMANCFEAVMGALFIDAGVEVVDRIFSKTLFPDPELHEVWVNYPLHPLQEQEPNGDRQWVESVPLLKKLRQFELNIGIDFNHIRLLARAFTHRSVGFNNLTLGSNQRMEFLGDTILQLIASEYLFRHFPEHHEGHLSLLRSSLVNNRTQAVVCDDLGMVEYVIYAYANPVLKIKDKADLLEAFVGALYVDKGLDFCKTFCHVCFFPRLRMFIMNQDWNDPKSKLQQCCLTLRTMEGGEPDIPIYKVIECKGPTNTRVFTVAVYFRGQRLAKGTGHSIQRAEMAAAEKALESQEAKTWPQLKFQKKVIQKSIHMDKMLNDDTSGENEPASSGGGGDQNKISMWVDH